MEKYFAYGSNMKLARMIKRIKREIPSDQRRRATLRGYRLEFNKKAERNPKKEGYANIVPDEKEIVEGAIYDDMSNSNMEQLDICECCPKHYGRSKVKVEDDHGDLTDAITYIAQLDKVTTGLKPTKDYLSHLLEAKDLLSKDYYSKLKDTETLD